MRSAPAFAMAALVATAASAGPASAAWTKPVDITPRGAFTIGLEDIAVGDGGRVVALGATLADADGPGGSDGLVAYSSRNRERFEGETVSRFSNEFPAVCFDRAGATLVLATQNARDNAMRVYTRPRGGRFGAGQIVGAEPGAPYDIVTGPTGEVFAYWIGADAGASEQGPLRIAVRPAGSREFGPMQELSGRPARNPRLVLDRRGNALLAWSVRGELRYAVRPRGGSFGSRSVLAPAVGDDYAVESNDAGRAVAVWRARIGRRRELRAAFGDVATGFGPSRRLAGKVNRGPYLAVDRGGAAVAAWRAGTKREPRLRAAIARSGAARFARPRTLSTREPEQIGVTGDRRGTQTVAWRERTSVRVARHKSGASRFVRQAFAVSAPRGVWIEGTGDGRTVVAWRERGGRARTRVRAAVARGGDSFGAPATVARFPRREFSEGPYVEGGGGGAFVWWGRDRVRENAVWSGGSWLLP